VVRNWKQLKFLGNHVGIINAWGAINEVPIQTGSPHANSKYPCKLTINIYENNAANYFQGAK